jgi:hypothetical protein
MAEAFVRTIKRDYVHVSPRPDAVTVMHQLSSWFAHYNEVHPHKALGYRSPLSSSQLAEIPDRVRSFGGDNTVGPPAFHRRARAHPAIRHSDRRFSGHSCRDTTSPMPPSTSVTILDRQGLTEASCECYQLVRYARRFSPSQNIRVILSAHP